MFTVRVYDVHNVRFTGCTQEMFTVKAIKSKPVGKIGGKPKNKLTFEEKAELVISAMRKEVRRLQVVYPDSIFDRYGKLYSMAEIARLSGFARSTRFMLFLYEMCDRKLIAKSEWTGHEINGRGICDVNIQFCLPEHSRDKVQKSMFTELSQSEGK